MKFPSISTASDAAATLALLSLAVLPQHAAAMFQCDHVVVDNQKFDLSALDGAHSVVMSRDQGASYLNTTYTVDICRPLKKKGDVPKDQECPNGSRGTSNYRASSCPTFLGILGDLLGVFSFILIFLLSSSLRHPTNDREGRQQLRRRDPEGVPHRRRAG